MTIRSYLYRRFYGAFALLMLTGLGMMIMAQPVPGSVPISLWIGMPVFAGLILYLNFGIRCPGCRGNLGITLGPALLSGFSRHPVHDCPFCGVSIDQDC